MGTSVSPPAPVLIFTHFFVRSSNTGAPAASAAYVQGHYTRPQLRSTHAQVTGQLTYRLQVNSRFHEGGSGERTGGLY